MPDYQPQSDYARASPLLSDAQRHNGLDAVRNKRARQTRLRVATLNIGTLTGKSREIADVMLRKKIDILCLQDTRWTGGKSGGKARNLGDGFKLYYSGGGKPRNGIGICLSEEWQDKVIETNRKSDRVMTMKLVTPDKTYNIITAYAPQQGCDKEEKQRFWNQLAQCTDSIPHTEEVILAGDLNGHVGTERDEYERWHGGKTRGRINDEGETIVDFMRASDLALVNTFFTQRDEHTYTFKSGPNQTVIDYITVRRNSLGSVKNCKVIPGEPIAPQHQLLVIDMSRIKRKRKKRKRTKQTGGNSRQRKGKN